MDWFGLKYPHDKFSFSFTQEKIRALKVGDEVLISGVVFTGRDAVHKHLHEGGGAAQVLADCIKKVRNVHMMEEFSAPKDSSITRHASFSVQIMWQNMPSRSFGSNQVLLGGMIPPVSATTIKSSMSVGNIEKAQAYSPLSTSFSSSSVPRMPPTK